MRKTNMLTKAENISELLSFNGNNRFVSYCQKVIYLWLTEYYYATYAFYNFQCFQ